MEIEFRRTFECFFNFLGWWQWSLGFHVDVRHPHIDVHVPGGYLRVGWYNPRAAMLQSRRRGLERIHRSSPPTRRRPHDDP
jgi:hypothetical protein